MTVELRPGGVACNLGCTYCYQEPLRQVTNNKIGSYDIDLMLEEAKKTKQEFNLFGGEILLIPIKDLEKFFKTSYEWHGKGSIQTNGTLITDKHIELFKKYNVHVGISIDGPEELNDLRVTRKNSTKERIREHTQKTIDNMKKLVKNGIGVGVIITIHKLNGTGERLQKLKRFIRELGDIGIRSGNVHTLEVDSTMPDQEIHVVTPEENVETFLDLANFFSENEDLSWAPFRDMFSLLIGHGNEANCIWHNCDPWNTRAVYGIEGDGALSNCGRTNKEGIDWYKSDKNSYARYISLYHTPIEMDGCKGCRFWSVCGGSCPGEAGNGDFRNKTIHCKTQYSLLEYYERKAEEMGITPITKSIMLPIIEKLMLQGFEKGEPYSDSRIMFEAKKILSKKIVVPVIENTEGETI